MNETNFENAALFAYYRTKRTTPYTYDGKPFYKSLVPDIKNRNPTTHLGLASALHADFINICSVNYSSPEFIRKYSVVIAVVSGPCDIHIFLDWIRKIKSLSPKTLVGLGFDGTVLTHKILCRNWEFQRGFYLAAQLADFVCADGGGQSVVEYFGLFSAQSVSLPWAVPIEYIRNEVTCFKPREAKQKIFRAGGYVMGRIGCDGYAHVVPLIEAQKRFPEFKIQILKSHYNAHQIASAIDWSDVDSRWFRRPFQFVFNGISRASSKFDRVLGLEEDLSKAPLILRGVSPKQIISKALPDWRTNLHDWGTVYLGIDMDTSFNGGRAVIDAALAGTPMIGCNSSFQRALFPDLCVDDGAYRKAGELISRLVQDPHFYDETVRQATAALEEFNEVNTRRRFRQLVERYSK